MKLPRDVYFLRVTTVNKRVANAIKRLQDLHDVVCDDVNGETAVTAVSEILEKYFSENSDGTTFVMC